MALNSPLTRMVNITRNDPDAASVIRASCARLGATSMTDLYTNHRPDFDALLEAFEDIDLQLGAPNHEDH